jgi:hypothetical protein
MTAAARRLPSSHTIFFLHKNSIQLCKNPLNQMDSILVDGKKAKTARNCQSEQIPVLLVSTLWRNYMRDIGIAALTLTWQVLKCVGKLIK